jgi:hypothetical protein
MTITLQYFDGCPNWKLMEQRLAQALLESQVAEADVVRERVESPEEAVRLGFRGSPTVLIDGKDPFASERDAVGLACRVYRTANGQDGLPSVEELRAALVPMGGLDSRTGGSQCTVASRSSSSFARMRSPGGPSSVGLRWLQTDSTRTSG